MKKTVVIAFALVLSFSTPLVAVSQSSSTLKNKKSSLSRALGRVKEKRNEIRTQLNKKEAETKKMMDEIHRVDRQMAQVSDKIDLAEKELNKSKREQKRLTGELEEQTAELDRVREQAATRIRGMYQSGKSTPLTFIATSKSMGDMAMRKAVLSRIAENDKVLFEKVQVLRDMVLAKKKEQDRVVANIMELTEKHEADLKVLEDARIERKQIFNVLKAQEDQLEDQFKEFDRESRRLEGEIYQIQMKLSGSVPIFGGKFIQPVSGRVSSNYGYRIHPIKKTRKLHTGIDFAARSGTPIKAAGPGQVIFAGYRGGYGYAVIIDHGGGISTLYGHCSRLFVSSGQRVTQGQKIAAVGSTGLSTGPHLHFEVRKNGSPVNPRSKM